MAERMTDYVLRLAHDPSALATFQEDPERAMTQAGLSKQEQTVLVSKDAVAIRDAFVSHLGADMSADFTWVVVVVDVRAVAINQ